MARKPKPKPKPKPKLEAAKKRAKNLLADLLRRAQRQRDADAMTAVIERALQREAERKIQEITGKDRFGQQRGKRTKEHPRGRGI